MLFNTLICWTQWSCAISVHIPSFVSAWFFPTGMFQRVINDQSGMIQPTWSCILLSVLRAIIGLFPNYIKFPYDTFSPSFLQLHRGGGFWDAEKCVCLSKTSDNSGLDTKQLNIGVYCHLGMGTVKIYVFPLVFSYQTIFMLAHIIQPVYRFYWCCYTAKQYFLNLRRSESK